ncbi:conserved protein, unknown function, partial [Hepatocystis sp. ex Piliocolobus tephrosceles]
MGNYLGIKETKANKNNLHIFEKRYGYNLNELHSYIYTINLPLKPQYINYILEGKKKNQKEETQEKTNISDNYVKEQMNDINEKNQNIVTVDIYNQYEKENINNANNIYKNELIIHNKKNNNNKIEKYEDMYVHMSYNDNYLYEEKKNNIYTDDDLVKHITMKTNNLDNSETHLAKEKNKKKTYINLCLNYYNNLDTCVIKKYQKNVENKKDKKLMNKIKKREINYYNSLNKTN